MTVTLPPDFPEDERKGSLRWQERRRRAQVARQNREARIGATHADLNGLGFPPIAKVKPPLYGYTRSGARRRKRGIWLPVTLILLCLAVGAAVWLSYRHWTGKAENNPVTLSIILEEAPVQASPVPGASSPWPEPPDSWQCHITHYWATDGAVTASGLTVRECKDRADEMGLTGFCAVGQGPGDPDWYNRIRDDSPPVLTILTGAAAGTYIALDRCPRGGIVDVFLDSTEDQYSYTTSVVEEEVR